MIKKTIKPRHFGIRSSFQNDFRNFPASGVIDLRRPV